MDQKKTSVNSTGGLYFLLLLCFLLLYIFNDFCQINYRNIYGTDLHPICRDGRTMAVDERTEVFFSIFKGQCPWQPILWISEYGTAQKCARWRAINRSALLMDL